MERIFLAVILIAVLSTAIGIHILHLLKADKSGYSAPLGFAFFLAALQIGYYPVQLLHGSFTWIIAVSLAVIAYGFWCLFKEWKDTVDELFHKKSLILLAALAGFTAVFYLCFVDLEFADSPMYLNYIAQNIGNKHINLFNLYTGQTGSEWDALYLYQGYYHFCSFFVWMLNLSGKVETLKAVVWGMGMLYSIISSMLIINITDHFEFHKKWQKGILLVFALFYLNFYYWRVVDAYYGNTWRTLFITLLMFTLYRVQEGEFSKNARVIIPAICFAGLASSSSFLFISFAVLSVYAAYLFLAQKECSLYNMSLYILPIAVYASIMMIRMHQIAGLGMMVFFALYYSFCRTDFVQKILDFVEGLLIKHARKIFLLILPVTAAGFSLYIHIAHPDFLYGYSYFFQNHQNYDMVKDYFFVYSTWYDNLINILRWSAMILLFVKAEASCEKYMRTVLFLTILIFMNPLCTPAVAYTIASNVFYRAWEAVFNPFTEIFLFSYLMNQLQDRKVLQAIPAVVMAVVLGVSNVLALKGDKNAQYGYYIANRPEEYGKVTKMETYALDGIEQLAGAISLDRYEEDEQPVILSQAEGTRIYIPNAFQLVTARDTYYPGTRINEDLYQIARRHHDWETDAEKPDYSLTSSLLDQYHVNYILVRYWENPEFDEQLQGCCTKLYENKYFRLYRYE